MRCGCGRLIEPRDFTVDDGNGVCAVCPRCHIEMFQVELDETNYDDDND
jgi:hypothetical protein